MAEAAGANGMGLEASRHRERVFVSPERDLVCVARLYRAKLRDQQLRLIP
jgi:hypothetical protein